MNTMRYLRRVGDARRSIVPWVADGAVAVLAFAAAMPNLLHDAPRPPALAIPVLVIVVAPLALRRRFPVPVFAWVLLTAVAAALWNNHVVAAFAVLIALYTIAAVSTRGRALIAAAVLEAVVVVVAVAEAGGGWWYDSTFLSGLVGAALGLGLYASTRRAYLGELQDRALRLQNERDQQGALATAAERARIAREMHDIVAHHLTVMVALSDGAIAATAAAPERGIEVMRTVSATGRTALVETRRLLGVLRPSGPHEDGALQPVPDLAELDVLLERVRAAGLPTTLEVHGAAADLPAGVQLTVYRLVQEALTNTLKHAGPQARASVRLRYLPGELRVDVDDDGAGAAALTPTAAGGAGLSGMRERVHIYGGDVHSGPGRSGGWQVSARLHLDEARPT